MSTERSEYVDQVQTVATQLVNSPAFQRTVERLGQGTASEHAWEIATGLADIRESSTRLFEELLPMLLHMPADSPDIEVVLHDIGEEYRHMLYHITQSRYFKYVTPAE